MLTRRCVRSNKSGNVGKDFTLFGWYISYGHSYIFPFLSKKNTPCKHYSEFLYNLYLYLEISDMATFGYRRVRLVDQKTARQLDGMTFDREFEDKTSCKDTELPALKEMLTLLREGDHLFVHSMDRLARNLQDLLQLIEKVNQCGASITFIKENLTFPADKSHSPISVLLLQLLGAVVQFERSLIKERQREGIAKAKTRGAYRGRAPLPNNKLIEAFDLIDKGYSVVKAAQFIGISKSALYTYLAKRQA